jgi:cell division initiation protein
MRITPLEIRQQSFEKIFRGYDPETVDAFLLSLSQEWERQADEMKGIMRQMEVAEKESTRMKEIESSLFKTLKAAEDVQKQINAEAEEKATNTLKEANDEEFNILADARKQANRMINEAENKARFIIEEAQNELNNLERDTKSMERYREQITAEMKMFANDFLEKVNRFEEKTTKSDFSERQEDLTSGLASLEEQKNEALSKIEVELTPESLPVVDEAVTEIAENVVEETPEVVSEVSEEAIESVVENVTESTESLVSEATSEVAEVKENSFFDDIK